MSDAWKVQISGGAFHSHSRYTLSDSSEYATDNDRYNGSGLLVRSLGDHWSLGFEQTAVRSTFDNYDFKLDLSPGIEFDVFPYKESSRRQMEFVYSVGLTHANYQDTTLFNKVVETRPFHKFILAAQAVQPWGSLSAQTTLSSAPNENSRYLAVHAAIPTSSIFFTPSRRKNHGIAIMKNTSDICPSVILPAAFATPISLRKGLANA